MCRVKCDADEFTDAVRLQLVAIDVSVQMPEPAQFIEFAAQRLGDNRGPRIGRVSDLSQKLGMPTVLIVACPAVNRLPNTGQELL